VNRCTFENGTSVAERPRHALVDFRDDDARRLRGRERRVHRCAERAVTVAVRWGQLKQRHVEWNLTGREQRRNIREEDRDEVGIAAVDCRSHVRAGKQRDGEQAAAL
jgi:hypothetical protein